MNVNRKLISKVLAERIKKVIPSLMSKNQVAYAKGRFISKGGRLIFDIREISEDLEITGFLMTLDTGVEISENFLSRHKFTYLLRSVS